jgi:uncharacterized repeat protein (TIGR01451 family)
MRRRFSLITSAVLGASLLVLGAPEAVAAPSVLTKTAQNVTNPGANPVNHADVLNWVVNYTNNGPAGPATATITDAINGAGTAQTLVPGSLHTPPGWTPSWSTDGTNFGGTDTGTATTAVRAANANARPGGTNLSAGLVPPVQPSVTATGGDGWTPILYRTVSGTVEAWNMYHHAAAANAKLVCTDLSAGALCAGGPWPKPVNTAPGPFGSGNTGDIASPLTPQYVNDPGRPGVTYYAAVTVSSIGVGCLDLATRANCGYVPLGTGSGMGGLVTLAGNLYGVSTDGSMLCMVIATQAPCAGQPYAGFVPPNNTGGLYLGSMTVAGGKVFASSSPAGLPPVLGCFDPATGTACAGWAAPLAFAAAGFFAYNAFTAYNAAGAEVGACATRMGTVPQAVCFTVAGAPMTAPTVFNGLPSGVISFNPETVTAPNGHLNSYFGMWSGGSNGATVCYDWTTQSACAGFPLPAAHPTVNGGVTRDYGYAYDTVTQCLIGLGDAGILFSLEPATGGSPCVHSGASVELTPAGFYCDGGTGHVQGYQNAKLENINLANVNLAASTVDVSDTGGGVIANPGIAPDGTIDLSGISYAAHPSITTSVHLVLNNGNDFTGGNNPTLVLNFTGDPPQVCFKTTVASTCTVTAVSNTATGTDVTGALTSNTVSFPVAPGPNCQPNVTVNKEVCSSTNEHQCLPGGIGPWVKRAGLGPLSLLGATIHWRITVTNSGPVAISSATLNDTVEPGCVTAAGTFTLAAGASVQFFCNTHVLTSLLSVTNHASATYTPANSPPGTAPTTTASSSAKACAQLLCL